MNNYRRKIQLIAGSSYSISLPKKWIEDLNLKPQQELFLLEQEDMSLLISPNQINFSEGILNFNITNNAFSLKQILISAYYYGYEEINFFSDKEINKDFRKDIREGIVSLSGAEIIYEDKKIIKIKVVLGNLNFDLLQIFYRINLLIESSIENIVKDFDWKEIKLNEDEVDRLYNLSIKVITASMSSRDVLVSSKIKHMKLVPSYFLIAKKMENIADNLKKIARLIEKDKSDLSIVSDILMEIKKELNKSVLYLIGNRKFDFKISFSLEDVLREKSSKLKNNFIQMYLENLLRYLIDIQKEVSSISFYGKIRS